MSIKLHALMRVRPYAILSVLMKHKNRVQIQARFGMHGRVRYAPLSIDVVMIQKDYDTAFSHP